MLRNHTSVVWLKTLVLSILLLLLLFALGGLMAPPAAALLRQVEEAPGQIVYQSRETLKDQHGQTWQAIAFKRIQVGQDTRVNLRLVGFPGGVEIDHTQPLILKTALGDVLMVPDISDVLFSDSASQPHIGQYDLQAVLPLLKSEVPLYVSIATQTDERIVLGIPARLLEEWRAIAACGELVC